MRAPCESCPPHCSECAWDHTKNAKPAGKLVTIRTEREYGCVRDAAVVLDTATQTPFMQVGGKLHPLSEMFGGILVGTRLSLDIAAATA